LDLVSFPKAFHDIGNQSKSYFPFNFCFCGRKNFKNNSKESFEIPLLLTVNSTKA